MVLVGGVLIGGLSLSRGGGWAGLWRSGVHTGSSWATSGNVLFFGDLVSGSVVSGRGFCTRFIGCFSGIFCRGPPRSSFREGSQKKLQKFGHMSKL